MTKKGRCSVCDVYKPLNERGLIRLHKRHDVTCPGSAMPPVTPKPRPSAIENPRRRTAAANMRLAVFERDRFRCRKCGFNSPDGAGLELHHIHEYAAGGTTTIDNLHTLCSMCHREWTWLYSSPPLPYEDWLTVTPAALVMRLLLEVSGRVGIDSPRLPMIEAVADALGLTKQVAEMLLRRSTPP